MIPDVSFSDWWLAHTGYAHATPEAVEIFIEKRFARWTASPPVDPSIYARRLGCAVIVENVPAGRLEVSVGQMRIRVPRSQTSAEQRFSAAHELAHLLLLECHGGVVRRPFRLAEQQKTVDRTRYVERTRLERLCDQIARIMLVPTEYLRRVAPKNIDCLFPAMVRISSDFDVPLEVVFERLVETTLIPRNPGTVLMRFGTNQVTDADPKWRVVARAVPGSEFARKFPMPNQSLDNLGVRLPPPDGFRGNGFPPAVSIEVGVTQWRLSVREYCEKLGPRMLISLEPVQTRHRLSAKST